MDEQRRAELTERLERADEDIAAARESDAVDRRRLADGLADKAWALRELGEPAEALALVEQLLQELQADGDEGRVPPQTAARALLIRSGCLGRLNRPDERLADLDTVVSRFGDDDRIAVRERVAEAAWLRLRTVSPPRSDEATLELARDLLRRCTDAPSAPLDRYAALALGVQADTQRRLGDLRAAIATARWLLSEYADVRPRSHPLLVFDSQRQLVNDLINDDRPAEAAQVAADLIAALEDADENLAKRQTRIADALSTRAFALRRDGSVTEADAVGQELQARFASAEERSARLVAVQALIDLIAFQLRALDVDAAILTADELLARFTAETDPKGVTELGEHLEEVFRRMLGIHRPERVRVLAALASCSGVESLVIAGRRRPRLKPIADELRRVQCAEKVNTLLSDRFRDDPDARRRSIYLMTVLGRAAVFACHGHMVRCAKMFNEFCKLGAPAVSAIVDDARPITPGHYPVTVWGAAFLGTTMDLGAGPEADRTRASILEILRSDTVGPRQARRTAWLGQRWMADQARKSARRAAAIT